MLPLDGYIRVSKVGGREGEGFISPDVQEQAIRDWTARQGVEVVIQPHELNVSGGTMDRPVFNKIMDRVRRGESGGVVVYKTDRFARTLLGALNTLAELGEHDAAFASVTEPQLDYTTPAGRAFVQQMFVFAEYVRAGLKESWAVAQRSAVERGIHISPTTFLGYDRGLDKRLVPNADAPTVQALFRRRAQGEGWGALAEWLNEVAPKPNGTLWNGGSVQRLCEKRVYRGEASRYVTQDVDGRGAIVNPNAHPALVTEEEWQAAQMNPRLKKGGANGNPLPLLSGLIRCAGCRYSLSVGRGPKGERLYRCRGDHASGKCTERASVMADVIEAHVEAQVLAEISGPASLVPDSSEREAAQQALAEARERLEDFRRDHKARKTLGPEWNDWLADYVREVRRAEAELARLDARVGAAVEGMTQDHFSALPLADRREVLGGFIDAVIVRKSRGRGRNVDAIEDRTRILWRGQAHDLPLARRVNSIIPFDFTEEHVEAGVVAAQNSAQSLQP